MRPYLGVGAPRKAALVVIVNAVLLLLLIVVVVAVAVVVVVVVVVLLCPPHGDSHISHSGGPRPYLHRRLLDYSSCVNCTSMRKPELTRTLVL